jgi:Probable cobalt transporter subunit (CbtA)
MVRTFLVRGMLVGVIAGLLLFGFLKIYGEPQVDRAIAFETQMDEAKDAAEKAKGAHEGMHMTDDGEPELVSRPVQAGLGLFVAVVVYSAAFGGLFGLAFAFAYGRLPDEPTPQATSALLAAMGFIAIYLVPNLKYPTRQSSGPIAVFLKARPPHVAPYRSALRVLPLIASARRLAFPLGLLCGPSLRVHPDHYSASIEATAEAE